MFDASRELSTYYESHVRLSQSLRKDLADYRQLNLDRLTDGLKVLSDKRKVLYKTFADTKNQGSYAMHTLNQCEHTDYDIDVAVIWDRDNLPPDAKEAKERVRDALLEKCQNFSREPTARGNAVTVWYSDGYHIDFAIYRQTLDANGNVTTIEHAGAEGWARREPLAFSDWFNTQVATKSPPTQWDQIAGTKVSVSAGQLRRVVRFAKAFARSRAGWALPGGIAISTLVCETFVRDSSRDDVSLANTLRALLNRLRNSLAVDNPTQPGSSLVHSEKRRREVERLRDKLAEILPSLDVLDRADCTHAQAMAAWADIFNHEFWRSGTKAAAALTESRSALLDIECWLAREKEGAVYQRYRSGGAVLPKGVHLRFTVNAPAGAGPYELSWGARNEGDEAHEASEESWDRTTAAGQPMWTSTKYKGRHRMLCEMKRGGTVVGRGEFIVRIGPNR
jgi:hypothetical protein